MDSISFDRLTRVIGEDISRRAVLRAAFAAAVAGLGITTLLGPDEVEGKSCQKRCKHKAKKHDWSSKKKQACLQKCTPQSSPGQGGDPDQGGTPGQPTSPPPPTSPTPGRVCNDGELAANGQVCINNAFRDCSSAFECPGKVCLDGRCRGGEACDDANDVCRAFSSHLWCDTSAGAGTENICVLAESNFNFFCETSGDCSDATGIDFGAEAFCLLQGCTRSCDDTTPCTGPFDGASCVGKVCLF